MLVVFAILVGMNQYVRNPITCWSPVHFTDSHTDFSASYCWVKNTYYLPFAEDLSDSQTERSHRQIQYYQWVPFILLTQAIFFYIPSLLWHSLNNKAGVDADNILEAANTFSSIELLENREKTLTMLIGQLDRFLGSRQKVTGCNCDVRTAVSIFCCIPCGKRFGTYLIVLYLVMKLLYIANAIGQLFLLDLVLNAKFSSFGVDIAKNVLNDKDWTDDSYVAFPRVTLCDFRVRGQDMYNVHQYTLQCVLPINLYNEKIYIFLWFWLLFVAAVTVVSFFLWLLRFTVWRDRDTYVVNHLKRGNRIVSNRDDIRSFSRNYLKQDGAFILRLISHNSNSITTTEIICALWDFWLERESTQSADETSETRNLMNSDNSFEENEQNDTLPIRH